MKHPLTAVKLPRRFVFVCLLGCLFAGSAHAATFEVTNTSDGATDGTCDVFGTGDGCTLREAITAANGAAGDDTITFRSGVTGTITLGGTELGISSNTALTGPGANLLTVSGNNASRVINISSGTVSISGLTISNGRVVNSSGSATGGGILAGGTAVTISDCLISNNSLSASNQASGGGIVANAATFNLIRCAVTGNSASNSGTGQCLGGGIFVNNSVTPIITNCTISGNSVTGGSIAIGGGALLSRATTFINCTITNNSASGATTVNEGGGLRSNGGSHPIGNNIIAGNSSPNSPDVYGFFNSLGYNLIGDTSGAIINGTTTGNQLNVTPNIDALGNYGGPTPTHRLQSNSPALDAGDPASTLATDQRGYGRPVNGRIDIGAFELDVAQSGPNFVVNSTRDENDGTCGVGHCTLREAVIAANSNSDASTITFSDGTGGTINFGDSTARTITLGGTQLSLNSNITINGPGANLLTISGNNAGRVFKISSGTVEIKDLTIANGNLNGVADDNDDDGAGIDNRGSLTVTRCVFSGNVARNSTPTTGFGAGIYSTGALTVSDSTFSGNWAMAGGGIASLGGSLQVSGSTFVLNDSRVIGGAIYIRTTTTASIQNSTFSSNSSSVGGGTIFCRQSPLSVLNCTLNNNTTQSGTNGILLGSETSPSPSLTIGNTILASATDTHPNLSAPANTVTSQGYNLSDDDASAYLNQNTDQNSTDPNLGPLQDNGGPTQTHALLTGSPAINAANDANAPATDQRGVARPQGAHSDIGAVEYQEADSLVVTTTSDTVDNTDGLTSLREAINFANSHANGGTADEITFVSPLFDSAQTIQLSSTLPSLSDDVTITGPGANLLTVRGGGTGAFEIFIVNSSKNATFNGLTISNGFDGIANEGTVTVTNSTLRGNSSGVFNDGGTVTVTNSTLSNNSDAGIYNFTTGGTVTVTNSTFSGNDYGINNIANGSTVTVTNSTFSGNIRVGIRRVRGTVTLKNSIVAGNATDIDGTFTDGGSNITSGTAAAAGLETSDGNNSVVLKDNGGAVQTIALVGASGTAVNAGDNSLLPADAQDVDSDSDTSETLPTDARGTGFARIKGGTVDIGAYESSFTPNESLVVTTTADENNGTSDPAFGSGTSLREAINYANSHTNVASADEITFDSGVFGSAQVIQLGSALPIIGDDVTITGPGASLLTVKGNGASGFDAFVVNSNKTVNLGGLTINNSKYGIVNSGTLDVTNCIFSGNAKGIENTSRVNATNCTFSSNSVNGCNNSDTLNATNCTFSGNGNGIDNFGTLTLTNCTFSGNAKGIESNDAVTAVNCTFSANTAFGIQNTNPNISLTVNNTICVDNSVDTSGAIAGTNNIIGGTAAAAGLDPAGLADNGGPTQTIALIAGSPALNAGNNALIPGGVTTDQRGSARLKGVKVDIGAVEADGLLINNVVVTEGDSGLQNVTFDVTLSAPASTPVTVDYATGTTSSYPATPDVDFVSKTGSLGFAIGETAKQITVQVKGDTLYEGLERFAVNLSNASGALIIDGEGSVNITDNETASALRISDVTLAEGNSGTTDFVFTVSLTTPSSKTVSVTAAMGTATSNAATANVDYVPLSPTVVTFAPGETSKTVTIAVNGDLLNENNERFSVKLSGAVNAPISDSEGVGTITNDDTLPTLRINDVSQNEGDAGQIAFVFDVTLSAPSGKTVTVKYASATPSKTPASAGVDYTAVPLTSVTFLPGETSKQVTVQVNGDVVVEGTEKFVVKLSAATNASIADSEGVGTILNDDAATLLAPLGDNSENASGEYAPSE